MLKNKRILLMIIALGLLFLIPSICNATVEYTRSFPSNEGTIELNLKGLTLSDSKQYEFALVSKGGTPTDWFLITDYTTTTAKVVLSSGTNKIASVLKKTNNGQLFIREKDNIESYVVERLDINLKLPYLQSIAYGDNGKKYDLTTSLLYDSIGNNYIYTGADHTFTQWKKITDVKFIGEFLKVKNNGGDISTLEQYLPSYPTTGYNADRSPEYTKYNNGLYILWIKRTADNCKDVYSCIVHDGLPKATKLEEYTGLLEGTPTVELIIGKGRSYEKIGSNWEYYSKTGEDISIIIKFNQDIVLKEQPTLKIKFGTGKEIELTTAKVASNALTYTHTVKSGDSGTLQVISLSGGSITNNQGTQASYTLPAFSGSKVVAVNNEFDNKQPSNNSQNEQKPDDSSSTQKPNDIEKPSSTDADNAQKDPTIKDDNKLPQTGVALLSLLAISLIVVAVISKVKSNQYKDI